MTLPTIEQLEAMLANATKGPWADGVEADEYSVDRAEDGYDGLCWSAVGAASAVALVVVPCSFGMNDIQAANAALIELAPTLAVQRIADAKRIAELEAALRQAKKYLEHEPEYHDQGMGCGLEDRNITDRYDAMAHGWDQAMERAFSETVAAAVEEINTALEAAE